MIKLFKVVGTSSKPLALQGMAKYQAPDISPSIFVILLSESVDTDTNTKDVANTLPAISTDHLLMVRYTTFVKASVHLGLLHAMRTMFDIYVEAAHDWMSKENESVTRHLHDANVIAYDQWMKELEVWKMEWQKWKKKVDEVVAL